MQMALRTASAARVRDVHLAAGASLIALAFGTQAFAQTKSGPTEVSELVITAARTTLPASAHLRHWDREKYRLCIDLKPALDRDKLEARILRDLGENPNRDFEKIVAGLVPHSMVPVLLDRLEVPAGLKANSVTRQQRRALEELLKCFSVSVTGPRPVAEAIVTSGGVQVSQVQPSTMESKLAPGLYFAGEILDVDAYTGGFNLQIAWSTGHLAGTSAAGAEGE